MEKFVVTSLERGEFKQMLIEALNECSRNEHKKEENKTPVFLTQNQVLDLLGITLPTLLSWRKLGVIKAVKINRSVRYRREDIDSIFEKLPLIKYSRNLNGIGS